MAFRYAAAVRSQFPELVSRSLRIDGVDAAVDVTTAIGHFTAVATARLQGLAEGDLPEIQAWRRTFSKMGLKPTQYRCASEALLRRFRKEGNLPSIHPLIDLCNAVSLAYALPIAVFDLDRVAGDLEVRPAHGDEVYLTFGGEVEHPEPGEIIFADDSGRAHARRWTNRQSGYSAIRPETRRALVVSEAMHEMASPDTTQLMADLRDALITVWPAAIVSAGAD